MINNHSKNNHNNKNSQINKNNIPGRPAKSNVTAHNEHSVDTRELALEMLIEINERGAFSHIVLRSVLDSGMQWMYRGSRRVWKEKRDSGFTG